MNEKGNGEKSKLIYYLLSLLLAICGWFATTIYAKVAENDKRLTVLEANYANISKGIDEIRSILEKYR